MDYYLLNNHSFTFAICVCTYKKMTMKIVAKGQLAKFVIRERIFQWSRSKSIFITSLAYLCLALLTLTPINSFSPKMQMSKYALKPHLKLAHVAFTAYLVAFIVVYCLNAINKPVNHIFMRFADIWEDADLRWRGNRV